MGSPLAATVSEDPYNCWFASTEVLAAHLLQGLWTQALKFDNDPSTSPAGAKFTPFQNGVDSAFSLILRANTKVISS
jgi:hypothetical protein